MFSPVRLSAQSPFSFLGIRNLGEGRKLARENCSSFGVKLEQQNKEHLLHSLISRDLGCLSQVLTERELQHIFLSISLKQVLFIEENLAYVIHVPDRLFSIRLHLPFKYCQCHPHPDN